MNLNEYQQKAISTAIYPNIGSNIVYPTLGLCGESGEFAEKVKKSIRDDNGIITENRKIEMIKELGDVLWYISLVAHELKVTLDDVAETNLRKLEARKINQRLQGSGDNR